MVIVSARTCEPSGNGRVSWKRVAHHSPSPRSLFVVSGFPAPAQGQLIAQSLRSAWGSRKYPARQRVEDGFSANREE